MSSTEVPPAEVLAAERARRSLTDFVRLFWPIVEPRTPLIWSWHLDAICEHLEAVSAGFVRRLIISVPPGHMKSLLVSVFWPSWIWANSPEWRGLFASYAEALAVRDATRCRVIIESPLYRRAYCEPREWAMLEDQNAKAEYGNTARGYRVSVGVGGKATGLRGDAVVVDDPLNAMDALSAAARARVVEWWDLAMSTRQNDPRKSVQVVIAQRLHEEDLTGHLLARGGYEHLCLPSEFEPERRAVTCGGAWKDPRAEEGELLFPERFPRAVLDDAKETLGSADYAGQHQQAPTPRGGGMFRAEWWRRYRQLPRNAGRFIASVDCAFKGGPGSDFVAVQVWACVGAARYLVWSSRRRLTFSATRALVEHVAREWPLDAVLVEDKANGPAIVDSLRDMVPGVLGMNPGAAGKEARAQAITPAVEAGQVWIPEDPSGNVQVWRAGASAWSETGGWELDGPGSPVQAFLDELGAFPRARHDDQVDALSQALRWLREPPASTTPLATVSAPIAPAHTDM